MKVGSVRGGALPSPRKAGLRAGRSKIFPADPPTSKTPIVHDVFQGKKMLPLLCFSLTELAIFHMLKIGSDESELKF